MLLLFNIQCRIILHKVDVVTMLNVVDIQHISMCICTWYPKMCVYICIYFYEDDPRPQA